MKTILVPTDLSPMTDNALSVAVGLARTYQSEIILLHSAIHPMPMVAFDDELPNTTQSTVAIFNDMERDAREILDRFANNPAYAGVTIRPMLLTNGEGLVEAVTERPADLIVMASKGSSGLTEWLIGSNAEIIVRHAHCPVLIIKHPVANFEPEKVICAIDVDERLKAPHVYPFQANGQLPNQFLYVMTPTDNRDPDGVREWFADFAAQQGITNAELTIRADANVPEGIANHADNVQADLVVVYTHGHTGLYHLFTGSVAEDVLNHANVPVLIMRA
ncbi:universal stress protein [Fibrella aquatica]|uniref:universal stress protein n=1 Tax=Fibrella aquatica TaxID=3242487 RepID=UPI003520F025